MIFGSLVHGSTSIGLPRCPVGVLGSLSPLLYIPHDRTPHISEGTPSGFEYVRSPNPTVPRITSGPAAGIEGVVIRGAVMVFGGSVMTGTAAAACWGSLYQASRPSGSVYLYGLEFAYSTG